MRVLFRSYLPACSGLGLLGTECVACFNVARHRSTSFYCHRNGGVPAYAGHGADIDSGLDDPSGPWLAASAFRDLPDCRAVGGAFLVDPDRQSGVLGKRVSVLVVFGG